MEAILQRAVSYIDTDAEGRRAQVASGKQLLFSFDIPNGKRRRVIRDRATRLRSSDVPNR
jgi:hypothetical protein